MELTHENIVQALREYEAADMARSNAETIERLMRYAADRIERLETRVRIADTLIGRPQHD